MNNENEICSNCGSVEIVEFGFDIEPETAKMCATLKNNPLSRERIKEEWTKLFTKGQYPEKIIQYLIDTTWIKLYPELESMIDVQQDKIHHPEGVLQNHVSEALKAAVQIAKRENLSKEDKTVLMLSTLCHDMGKPTSTQITNGRITSHGHTDAGVEPTISFLRRIGIGEGGDKKDNTYWASDLKLSQKIANLVKFHMAHLTHQNWTSAQIAREIAPATMSQLHMLIEADISGRPPLKNPIPETISKWRQESESLNYLHNEPAQMILYKDINFLPIEGGKIGEILKHVYEVQIKNPMWTKEQLIEEAKNYYYRKNAIVTGEMIQNVLGIAPGSEYKRIKDEAWEAQKQGIIRDPKSAEEWLRKQVQFNLNNIQGKKFNLKTLKG